ncbi:MAG TPA: hypothetical protein VIL77_14360 [Gaiellaceae bacterium]
MNLQSHTPDDSWDLLEAARLHYEHRLSRIVASFTVGIVAAALIVLVLVLL